MEDENKKEFEPKQIAPALGNPHLSPLNPSHSNEIKIYYSRNVKIAGIIITAIIIILAFTLVYLSIF